MQDAKRAKPARTKVEPDLAAARKSLRNEASKRRQLEKRLAESLEREKATGEILRVISSSPGDLQPVLNAVAENAARLCDARDVIILRTDGDVLRMAASVGNLAAPVGRDLRSDFGFPITRGSVSGRAVVDRTTLHVQDLAAESDTEFPTGKELQRRFGHRTMLATPLLREDTALGVIAVFRTEVLPFSDKQIELLQTFADQAVIAIENVRLFTEVREKNYALTQAHAQVTEALEQQTATSEILRVIASSPTDVQPVFDVIAAAASTLCEADNTGVFRFDGDLIHFVAHHGRTPEEISAAQRAFPQPPRHHSVTARAILAAAVVQIDDVSDDPELEDALRIFRTVLSVPLIRDGRPLGAITVSRRVVRPFTDAQISLLKTFADQAVIAIENVRLFKELEARNADLTDALARQTATSEILRVISSAHTDAQLVFDTIVLSAARLCNAANAAVFRTDGTTVYEPANYGSSPEALAATRARYPRPLDMETTPGIAILTRSVVHIPDIEDPSAIEFVRQSGRLLGFRSVVTVPMLREGEALGAIIVARREPGRFSDAELELLKTFADQAVIAIENVRLFNELEARTQALARSVEQLTALGEVGQAVSSSLELETVLHTIVSRAVQLAGATAGTIWEYDDDAEEFTLRITHNIEDPQLLARRDTKLRKGEGAVGRLAVTHEPVQIPDITTEGAYESRLREVLVDAGTRALLAVPLLREGRILGGLVMSRRARGEFPPEVVEVLKTFATQSALAIQNARLFRELADKSRQLEAASRHKSEFLASMSHELRTPLNAVIGFSEVLLERMFGDLNPKQEEYLCDIMTSGRHLLSLINDILDLSKVEAGRMELDVAAFDLPTAIDDALLLMRERAGRRDITLERHLDEQLHEIRADERKVKQVLLNLLSNAVKFTPEGGRIEVRARIADGTAEISVTDTGIGIAAEDQDVVFEEFRQVGKADKKAEGTGLGLALCRKFVELHGGRIWVKSQIGQGSTFTFTMPLRQ